jgi:hypothetical protein
MPSQAGKDMAGIIDLQWPPLDEIRLCKWFGMVTNRIFAIGFSFDKGTIKRFSV